MREFGGILLQHGDSYGGEQKVMARQVEWEFLCAELLEVGKF